MADYLGDFAAGATVEFDWDTTEVGTGSIAPDTAGSLRIYRDNSTTERSSASGITDSRAFDSLTGHHHATIDLGDNTDAGFYAAGHEYSVVLVGCVIGVETFNIALSHFSIENRFMRGTDNAATASALATAQTDLDTLTGADGAVLATSQPNYTPSVAGDAMALTAAERNSTADALLDRANGVETGLTLRQWLRLGAAALFGKASGLATTTAVYRDTNDGTDRITATVDADGNRTAVTLDPS